jgi:ubiquinone/menaquinone biosynthesis C-methylase UbiE
LFADEEAFRNLRTNGSRVRQHKEKRTQKGFKKSQTGKDHNRGKIMVIEIKNANALKKRIRCHLRYAEKELNDWVFGVVRPQKGECILDLGCGTGKQLIPLAKLVGPEGKIVGVDISKDALEEVREAASRLGLNNITLVNADFDECLDILPCHSYALIHSSYAIYYSKDQVSFIQSLHKHLTNEGRIFICGRDAENNSELIDLLNLILRGNEKIKHQRAFISNEEIERAFRSYSKYSMHRFQNSITYPSVGSVLKYWRSYYLYQKKLEHQFQLLLKEYFDKNVRLVVHKKVLGVLGNA